ncbi:MAG TPA: glucosidase [Candidatus Polarisedimenticolia bacterium]|nr:glucosidase [Candidatus Polarisedimenticolia bacterium]
MNAEEKRLQESSERNVHWKRWGPYLSERQWGTVREDYSPYGAAWDFFPHDHARSRTYRWGEDGIMGISDRHQLVCFALAMWNGRDPILKERLFGLTGNEGNHGEDVKEYYFYLDSTPTHSYMKALYKYPQREFPYRKLVEENRRRNRSDFEYELLDTGAFDGNRYFDVLTEYAKASSEDILIRISATNRGPAEVDLSILPTIWFRNTWSWGRDDYRPCLRAIPELNIPKEYGIPGSGVIEVEHKTYGKRWLLCEGEPKLLFTENETNAKRLFGGENRTRYVKDGINDYIVHGDHQAVNPEKIGTKASALYLLRVSPGATATLRLRLTDQELRIAHMSAPRLVSAAAPKTDLLGHSFDSVLAIRRTEADEFYAKRALKNLSEDARNVQRQAFAGLLWSKQLYHFDVRTWLDGDPAGPPPPESRKNGRNHEWGHLYNADVISMPDKWEYPWYAAWDLAFHCIPLAQIDPDFAKEQLTLLFREWYMHPNGQLPAYEWAFGDVNPPVHAWAVWRVYKIERRVRGAADRAFLESAFHKLLLNFTWWVNRKDAEGMNIFQGGFLGLDNIGVFDRSAPLPTGGYLEQSDGTSWMGMYCLNMLAIALELARENPAYENVASKFFEHFVHIARAMNDPRGEGIELWDNQDGFYYDVLHLPNGDRHYLKVRSLVGLIPLLAVETFGQDIVDRLPGFKRRMQWFIDNHSDVRKHIEISQTEKGRRGLLSLVNRGQLERVLRYLLDESEFLSPYGVRAISKFHKDNPYVLHVNGTEHRVDYEPAESSTGLFGGNSNWRGPVWFPINFLLIEALQKFHHFYGDTLTVELPTGSGRQASLWDAATEISRRLMRIFLRSADGTRPVYGGLEKFQRDPHWRDCIHFHEYFHGDNGAGIGASHQTGWTGLVAKLLEQSGEAR